jgi:DNA-binding NtrC family response regulator
VARPRIWVIDNSPTNRETVAIVLGDRYEVGGLSAEAYARDPSSVQDAGLVIIGVDTLPPHSVASLPNVPVLWLERPGEVLGTTRRQPALPYPFAPQELRARVETLLAASTQVLVIHGNLADADYPIVPKGAAVLARRAAATRFPVLICGESGSGKARLARAIHSLRRCGQFLSLPAPHCTPRALQQASHISPGDITLFVTEIDAITQETEQFLLEIVDRGGFSSDDGWRNVQLICATTCSFEELARRQTARRNLVYKISVFPITLPPLRERAFDIPALARHIVGSLGPLLGAEPVTFTQRAMDRLVHYLWFGNLAELETVLTRSVVLAEHRILDAEDLLFGYGRLLPPSSEEPVVTREPPAAPEASETVDLVINELAHEFKNPMVTIKTVAQHLERLLADDTGREQVARLTGEAVDRMDRALENLLQFTRFRAPTLGDFQLNTLLSPCLSELAPTLTERRVLLDYRPPERLSVFVDGAQVVYAFENLLRANVRDLPEGQTLSVYSVDGTATVTFEFASVGHPLAGKLSEFLDHSLTAAEKLLPLGMVLAKTLIERNGGRIEAHAQADVTTITVWLPIREELAPGNGKTAGLSH